MNTLKRLSLRHDFRVGCEHPGYGNQEPSGYFVLSLDSLPGVEAPPDLKLGGLFYAC